MVTPVLQFGWKSKQAIIVSVILIAISDSNLFAVAEFLQFPHKLENKKNEYFLSWQVHYRFEENECFS